MYSETTRSVTVTVTPEYLSQQSEPENARYLWAYHIVIENGGFDVVQLINRYWRIVDGAGTVQEVHGAGVVGKQPILRPGERFEYSSGVPLSIPGGIMSGYYEMVTDLGEPFKVTVPAFSLDCPDQAARYN
jgi:ApaG protein